jgi:hypothetical protein
MKNHLFIVFLLVLTSCKTSLKQDEIIQFNYGTSFGHCRGYCIHITFITKEWTIKMDKTWADSTRFPTKYDSTKTNIAFWDTLQAKYKQSSFSQLDEKIGCPDCTDRGAEWLEIVKNNGEKKKSTFDYYADMGDLNPLLDAIEPSRKQNR